MATYVLTGPDGSRYSVTAPDSATPDQVHAIAMGHIAQLDPEGFQQHLRQEAAQGQQHAEDINAGRAPNPNLDKPSGWASIGRGYMDVARGAEVAGARVGGLQKFADAVAGQNVQEEQQYEAGRGPDAGFDWGRAAGQAAATAPLALVPGSELGLAGRGAALARTATSGALQGGVTSGLLAQGQGADLGQTAKATAEGAGLGAAIGTTLHAGAQGLVSYLQRNLPESLKVKAVQEVLKRFAQDQSAGGPTAQHVMDAMNAAKNEGVPMTLADVAGKNVQGLAGMVARAPGESRAIAGELLEGRDAQAGQRLDDLISNTVASGDTMHQSAKALFQARSAAARPAYELAMDPTKVVDSPTIRKIIADPTVAQGIPAGIESQRLEALANGEKFDPNVYKTEPIGAAKGEAVKDTMAGLANAPAMQRVTLPNMRLLDAAKRGLDQQIEGERDALTGRLSQRGVMLDRVRQKLVGELDSLNPDYANARAAWGGPSASLDAMRIGQNALRTGPEVNADAVANMTDNEKEFARLGLADKMREMLSKTGFSGDEAKALIKNEWVKKQIRPFFDSDESFGKFVKGVTDERTMFATKQAALGGSQTAGRLAEDQGTDIEQMARGASAVKHLLTGNVLGSLKETIALKRLAGARNAQELNTEIAKLLFNPDVELGGKGGGLLSLPEGPRPPMTTATKGGQALTNEGVGLLARAAGASVPAAQEGSQ